VAAVANHADYKSQSQKLEAHCQPHRALEEGTNNIFGKLSIPWGLQRDFFRGEGTKNDFGVHLFTLPCMW